MPQVGRTPRPKLTPTPQDYNDIYWCSYKNRPTVVEARRCDLCGITVTGSDRTHVFIAHVYNGDDVRSSNELLVLAEVVKGTDDAEAEIEVLRGAINTFAQQVHQAYHGAHPPDLCDVNHTECPRGLCRSVQYLLDPKRPRGKP